MNFNFLMYELSSKPFFTIVVDYKNEETIKTCPTSQVQISTQGISVGELAFQISILWDQIEITEYNEFIYEDEKLRVAFWCN